MDFSGKTVLVTGATSGIGLSTALTYARRGAQVIGTYRFGSADEEALLRRFEGATRPRFIQADAAREEDTVELMSELRKTHERIDILISNVTNAIVVGGLEDYDLRALNQTIRASAWPMVAYTRQIKENFGHYPRYVVGMSSSGASEFSVGYDFVAAAKSVMESLCRYLNYRLFDEEVNINVIRSRSVRTPSFDEHFGTDFWDFAEKLTRPDHFLEASEVANACVALTSGMMDAVRGEILTIDRGTTFFDGFSRIYEEREAYGL